jgi:hypothetical protein
VGERHPHCGASGVVVKISDSTEIRLVKLDDGKSTFVYDPASRFASLRERYLLSIWRNIKDVVPRALRVSEHLLQVRD